MSILPARDYLLAAAICLIGLLAIFGAQHALRDRIAHNRTISAQAPLLAALPESMRTTATLVEAGELEDSEKLHLEQAQPYYQIIVSGQQIGWLLPVVANEGYSGAIDLVVALRTDGRILGINVLTHRETIGLGNRIERSQSQWLDSFNDRSLNNPRIGSWFVRRDGGEFDQITGATVTSRAVTKAVKQTLEFYASTGLPQSIKGSQQRMDEDDR